jgi:protein associated with RNAse G/E
MKTSEAVLRITVLKKNPAGEVTYEYEGVLLSRDEHSITLEALFDRADMPFVDTVLRTGDRFVEYYYDDRWYNIFEIHDRDDERIKGWYCNVCTPAEFEDGIVSYVDLALDLWVSSNGTQHVLDEDEFEALTLDQEHRAGALRGLDELKQLFLNNKPPT